jgi:preprotein translocase subunit SecG
VALDILMVLDVIVSILMSLSILLQSGKSSGFAGMGGGETLFGGKPTDMDEALSRFTVVLGIIFAVINVVIARLQ